MIYEERLIKRELYNGDYIYIYICVCIYKHIKSSSYCPT